MTDNVMWPVTIAKTRYGGIYEGSKQGADGEFSWGGQWAAFNCLPDEISPDAFADDLVADAWWSQLADGSMPHPSAPDKSLLVGFGATPEAALSALIEQAST